MAARRAIKTKGKARLRRAASSPAAPTPAEVANLLTNATYGKFAAPQVPRSASYTVSPCRAKHDARLQTLGRAGVLLDEVLEAFGEESPESRTCRATFDVMNRFRARRLWSPARCLTDAGEQVPIRGWLLDVVALDLPSPLTRSGLALVVSLTRPTITVDAETLGDKLGESSGGEVLVPVYTGLTTYLLIPLGHACEIDILATSRATTLANGKVVWGFRNSILDSDQPSRAAAAAAASGAT